MKPVAAAATLFALLTVGAQAVAEDDRAAKMQEQMQQTIERLDLTDEQIDKIKPVLEESAAARQEILSSYGIDPEGRQSTAGKLKPRKAMAMRKELEAVRNDTLGELEPILSDEQFAEFKSIQAERRAEMKKQIRGAQ